MDTCNQWRSHSTLSINIWLRKVEKWKIYSKNSTHTVTVRIVSGYQRSRIFLGFKNSQKSSHYIVLILFFSVHSNNWQCIVFAIVGTFVRKLMSCCCLSIPNLIVIIWNTDRSSTHSCTSVSACTDAVLLIKLIIYNLFNLLFH